MKIIPLYNRNGVLMPPCVSNGSKAQRGSFTKTWEEIDYHSKHRRIKLFWGKANKCDIKGCKRKTKRFEWSNISRQYKFERKDWRMLCVSHHRDIDKLIRYDRILEKV